MNQELTLRIILENPPSGIDFGLQKGSGSKYETIQKQRSDSKDLEFELTINFKLNDNSLPNFLGKFVQGTLQDRFIYIDIGTYAGQANTSWSRRLKIPLNGITSDMIKKLLADPNSILEATVPGTGKESGPNSGTVKPFTGWHFAKRKSNQ